ncbi:MAG TPA: hypothetical protein PKW98_18645 [Candidatus Wallbacteria bacterium]|nr:MAG: hypothetical protein BWY32_01411 [bacterium ADurb.Bin243]HOD41343.1 hypothetical protein [Candidatus Wallbacteria bacterium]HPG59844.1 hypothetical protein [Candidatus Wallbacteria bacterium]
MLGVDAKNEGIMRSYSGHGMIEKHPAGLTIAGVMGHELGHINGAKNLALAGGETVVSQNIQLNIEFEGSRLVATSGRATTVTARTDPASSYKNNIANFELEMAQKSKTGGPIKNLSQLKQAANSAAGETGETEDDFSVKAAQLSSLLTQQKQKLESKLQRLSENSAAAAKLNLNAPSSGAFAPTGEDTGTAAADIMAGGNAEEASVRDAAARRQASQRLASVREQISKIDNIMASLKIAKSVQMLNGLLQAVAGVSMTAGGDIAAATDSPASSMAVRAPSNRKSAVENMISLIEESLRGMMVNLKV